MRIDKKSAGLFLVILGIVLAAVAYKVVWDPYTTNRDSFNSQITDLTSKESGLKTLSEKRSEFENSIETYIKENQAMLDEYPVEIRAEDEILRMHDYEETSNPNLRTVYFNSLDYGMPTIIPTENEETTGLSLGAVVLSGSYQSTYKGLKKVIKEALGEKPKVVINSLSASMDETTGNLAGNMTVTQYYVVGQDKSYVEPIVSGNFSKKVSNGEANIFNSFNIVKN